MTYDCEICFQTYASYRAMMLCEEACIEENRAARKPPRTAPTKRYMPDDD